MKIVITDRHGVEAFNHEFRPDECARVVAFFDALLEPPPPMGNRDNLLRAIQQAAKTGLVSEATGLSD